MKSRIIGKKQLLIITLVGALGLSVFINWYYSNPKQEITEPELTEKSNLGEAQYVNSSSITDSNEFYNNANINRTKAHDLAKENLNEIINNPDSTKETVSLARERLFKLSEQIKLETDIENIIKSQTSSQCLVTLSDKNIEIIVPKDSINETSIVKIKSIILSKTELSSEQISIIEI
ncbi:MAG: SpoIIIAH-like family protein [Clostridia bacterium]|nr:SpoIIIAH-like family protein [Clostridia bacterium]